MAELVIDTPRWALPLLEPKRYKGAKGGRGSGKSHFFAELLVESFLQEPNLRAVCIREIQRSLKFSSKSVIEAKIKALGIEDYFEVLTSEIRSRLGDGLIIFQGMQDHTADSIKSLEGFDVAWVEEAQNLSKRSLELLRPTIRKDASEIWFSWNPEFDTDAVDIFFKELAKNKSAEYCLAHVNYYENPFLPGELAKEAEYDRRHNPLSFEHVWLGAYNTKSEAQIFKGKFEIGQMNPTTEPLHGLDFGFAVDPTAALRVYAEGGTLYIDKEAYKVGLELDDTATYISKKIPDIQRYTIRADNARPESISYLRRHGLPHVVPVKKYKGSVEDGIEFIKSFERVVIHPECINTAREFRLYSYKTDSRSGDILPAPLDEYNHLIDALRYALTPLMKPRLERTTLRAFL